MPRKEAKTAQIIQAATEEFLNKGLDAASMHNIAELAEVSKRTLYKYYSTKEDLFAALIDEILDQIEDMHQFDYSHERSIQEEIEAVVDAKCDLLLADSFLKISKIVIGELFKSKQLNPEQLGRMTRSELIFVEWIQQAQKDGRIRSDLPGEDIAGQFHSILKGQIYWPVLMGFESKDSIDLEKAKRTTVDFFMNTFCD